ncbi:MAG: hypothetical protein K2X99_11300 [Gemmatimonadaceae bacterium]|nr:hypothetical protein [Gemmatimonadaceae bacterium]
MSDIVVVIGEVLALLADGVWSWNSSSDGERASGSDLPFAPDDGFPLTERQQQLAAAIQARRGCSKEAAEGVVRWLREGNYDIGD